MIRRHRIRRWIAVGLLAGAAVTTAIVVLVGHAHEYRVIFQDAGQLVRGDVVRIGGTPVGAVKSVELTDDGRAEVRVSVSDDYAPLHEGTTATIRSPGLVSVAGRYVDISPASNVRPALADGGVIDADHTTSIVDLDQLFNTLDAGTRKGLDHVIHGFADWYDGREEQASASAREFPPALRGLRRVAQELTSDDAAFRQFVVKTGDALSAVTDNRQQLTDLVGNARTTAAALSSDTQALSTALEQVPPALHQGSDALAAVRPALTDLRRLTDATGPATRGLAPFLREDLRPVLARAQPAFHELRAMFAQPGADNDLLDALRDLPPLASLTEKTFPRARRALAQSTPVFSFARPYVPDLVAWARNFAGAMAPYDANGHYARTLPVFDAFEFSDDAAGGHLDPKPPAQRGTSTALSYGNLRRCPGAAAPAPADGSAPFVDVGPLANPDCDPSQRPGAAP